MPPYRSSDYLTAEDKITALVFSACLGLVIFAAIAAACWVVVTAH